MIDFRLEPLHWNTLNYDTPSGYRATGGFAKQYGFGHEEWNNNKALTATIDGKSYRFLYSQASVYKPSRSETNFVAFYSSHDGRQELIGLAAECRRPTEAELAVLDEAGSLDRFWRDAWALDVVQEKFMSLRRFRDFWKENGGFTPSWIAPADHVLWLETALIIDVPAVADRARLNYRHGSYTSVDQNIALRIVQTVPAETRNEIWDNIYRFVVHSEHQGSMSFLEQDLDELGQRTDINETTRLALTNARLGQGRFRADLDQFWGHACAVCGSEVRQVLKASHIVPWRIAFDNERIDQNNGILLAAHIDALFDAGLISFSDQGNMLLSPKLGQQERDRFSLPQKLRSQPNKKQCSYLARHRKEHGFP